jgi:hypothetical protein
MAEAVSYTLSQSERRIRLSLNAAGAVPGDITSSLVNGSTMSVDRKQEHIRRDNHCVNPAYNPQTSWFLGSPSQQHNDPEHQQLCLPQSETPHHWVEFHDAWYR